MGLKIFKLAFQLTATVHVGGAYHHVRRNIVNIRRFAPLMVGVIAIMSAVAAIGLVLGPDGMPPRRPGLRLP